MSVLEKMTLWATMDDVEVNNGELFEGVPDEDDLENDITAQVELACYHQVIRSSSAYRWFITSLYREFTLQPNGTPMKDVSSMILRCLPPGKVSKSRVPQVHCVTFEFMLPRAFEPGIRFAEMIIVTGLPDSAQVTTVEEYVRYMWPLDGLHLLAAFQEVVIDCRHPSMYVARNLRVRANGISP